MRLQLLIFLLFCNLFVFPAGSEGPVQAAAEGTQDCQQRKEDWWWKAILVEAVFHIVEVFLSILCVSQIHRQFLMHCAHSGQGRGMLSHEHVAMMLVN